LEKYIDYVNSESNEEYLLLDFRTRMNFTKMEIAFAMYTISLHAYRKANLYKRSAYQIYKMLCLFKHYEIYESERAQNYIKRLSEKAIQYLWYANEDLNVLELNKRKKNFGKESIKQEISLQNLLVNSEITRIPILVKELELKFELSKKSKIPKDLKKYYDIHITSPYKINYSIVGRIYQLQLKSIVNYEAYRMLTRELTDLITKYNNGFDDKSVKPQLDALGVTYYKGKVKVINSEINYILNYKNCNDTAKKIFGDYFNFGKTDDAENGTKIEILEKLIAETIYCFIDIVQLSETMDETFLFPYSFMGLIHKNLSFWIRLYETYEINKNKVDFKKKYKCESKIDEYLKKYLDEEWREQLSGYRENQRALSYYYKCLEMHNQGRAYHNMIGTMYYIKDDYNDRSDHFNIAEERHLIVNKEIKKNIDELENFYEDSGLYKVENYFY
jgi:hypothetical protein